MFQWAQRKFCSFFYVSPCFYNETLRCLPKSVFGSVTFSFVEKVVFHWADFILNSRSLITTSHPLLIIISLFSLVQWQCSVSTRVLQPCLPACSQNTKARPDHKQLRPAPISVSNDTPPLVLIRLWSGIVPPSGTSQERNTERRKWKFDYFQSRAGGDKRLVAHHQAEPAAVESVGTDLRGTRRPFRGERPFGTEWRCRKGFHQSGGQAWEGEIKKKGEVEKYIQTRLCWIDFTFEQSYYTHRGRRTAESKCTALSCCWSLNMSCWKPVRRSITFYIP